MFSTPMCLGAGIAGAHARGGMGMAMAMGGSPRLPSVRACLFFRRRVKHTVRPAGVL